MQTGPDGELSLIGSPLSVRSTMQIAVSFNDHGEVRGVRLPDGAVVRSRYHFRLASIRAALVERHEQVFGKRFGFAGDELSGEEQAMFSMKATACDWDFLIVIGRKINFISRDDG